MTLARILVPIRGDGHGENVLAHAAGIGRRFGAHIVALHARPAPEDLLSTGVALPPMFRKQLLEAARGLSDFQESDLRAHLSAACRRLGIEEIGEQTGGETGGAAGAAPPPRDRLTLSWREVTGRQADLMKRHGRLADLIAVARPERDTQLGANTLQAALHQTGRPVLMCPPAPGGAPTVGRHVMIAWAGSTENARAVAMTLDLIDAAERVSVLTIGRPAGGPGADELAEYLRVRGVAPVLENRPAGGDVGRAILGAAGEIGADLVVMGAYSHGHTRELVFGGATQHVIDNAGLPVVLVH